MDAAFTEAKNAYARGEVPVGAVLVDSRTNTIIASSGNLVESHHNPTAHAEMLVIQKACADLATTRIPYCDLYVTLEPCAMCAQAIAFARIRRLYFAAYDEKGGGVDHGARIFQQPTCHHHPEIYGGIREQEASLLLASFFKERR